MTINDIHAKVISSEGNDHSLMDQEISGTTVNCLFGKRNEVLSWEKCDNYARIIILLRGKGTIDIGGKLFHASEKDLFIQKPDQPFKIISNEDIVLIELLRYLTEEEFAEICISDQLPYFADYNMAQTYTEECKSEKTISRMLVPARVIPRFAMGSVQTSGKDMVEKHSHPMLEQFFLGMADNNCTALIDEVEFPFGSNTLLHIPLGSNHGILSSEDQQVHYYWMDFLFGEEGLKYMDTAHVMNE